MGAREVYREIVLDNIEYRYLIQEEHIDREQLDEIAELIVDTVCSARKTIRIAGDDYPAEVVKSRFMKLDSSHVRYVMDCMRENTTYVRNIKKSRKAGSRRYTGASRPSDSWPPRTPGLPISRSATRTSRPLPMWRRNTMWILP